ncbi:PREDICTED: uncharacterized protein LOC105363474 [Ceratosolen solmsi marchali]|uniref:MICOS complex subunit MIC13 n=1 Tax=Ceratosolen solmsi marchali TaxID=326594 RepID=A0AAJ7DX01_9HYME|nr:PREDICTED: uncharacterized protein LOC105363474 [Ceratosolen solmsi marchali]XP_011499472.1 PREDICTED: uncharacterized protein LOC105363474 [Ceratosolen solmsi marchali]
MGLLRSTLKFAVKGYVAWIAIDYTIQEGFWSGSNDSIVAFKTLGNKIKEIVPENLTNQLPKLNVNDSVKNSWNTQVNNAAELILVSPKKISVLIEDTVFQNEKINNTNVKQSNR